MGSPSENLHRAGNILRILGQHLPPEVFTHLGPKDTSRLLESFHKTGKLDPKKERELLGSFLQGLQSSLPKEGTDKDTLALIQELESILKEDGKSEPDWILELRSYDKEQLSRIVAGESANQIALVLCFADPENSARVLEEFPDSDQEEIILQIRDLDLSSDLEQDKLERFLRFKKQVLEHKGSATAVRDRIGKTAADLLTRMDPQDSQKLFHRIREKNPGFAENINEHLFRMEDLLDLHREMLNRFLSRIHPIVIAVALQGTELETRRILLEKLDPALASSVRLEGNSMGPVSLAEIETAQNGILEIFRDSVQSGSIKFRRTL
ncbi:endoflagellar motor switch protein [Leptospira perolatii]|uniref:Endoflagellar motor switch protein n=1 Tax=Leptospira perolatii TaxID=2023191 RepID=A0A2M9ZMJ1_9LEPT|nr:FliG C-terminal domain-containing protein [Leptospira perolatii]PJZ70046.1 endoflagellar motor switch protein [Leptospira perolatii]PJZ73234.1 endoflagellar motor switch protein [Leptospira perolatii]